MASKCRNAPAPFVSVRRTWSTESPISSPAAALPETRWESASLAMVARDVDRATAGA